MDPLNAYPTTLDPTLQPLVACLGYPVAGDPTQFVIERGIQAANLDWRIVTASVAPDQLSVALSGLRAMQFNGLAILPPHRSLAASWMDRLGPVASQSGQVTVARRHEAVWVGEDTRAAAVAQLLESQATVIPPHPLAVLDADLHRWLTTGLPTPLHSRIWSPVELEPVATESQPGNAAASQTTPAMAEKASAEKTAATQSKEAEPTTDGPANALAHGAEPGVAEIASARSSTSAQPRTGTVEQPDSRPPITLAGLISCSPLPPAPPAWIKAVQWTEQPLWICLEDPPSDTGAPGWLSRFRPKRLPPELLRLHQAAVDFQFWTGQAPSMDVLREAFDEFLDL